MPPTFGSLATSLVRDGRIYRIQFDTPGQNTLDWKVVTDLADAVAWADSQTDVQGILLGSSEDGFCAGADLSVISAMDAEEGNRFLEAYHALVDHLHSTGKPAVASVSGTCVAGGQELALGCDMIVAERGATFGMPEVLVGSTAGGGGIQLLPLIVGERRARELLLTGELISASDAAEMGLVNRLVEDEPGEAAADLLEEVLDTTSPQAYRIIKAGLNRWSNFAMSDWDLTREMTAAVWASDEFAERAQAFLDGESPSPRAFAGLEPQQEESP